MSRFVVLRHELPPGQARRSHYDLLVERGDALAAWALDDWPTAGQATAALRLPDHRRDYLTYEGPVSGGRGQVTRLDEGSCKLLAVLEGEWTLQLRGKRWQGELNLRRDDGERWTCRWRPDTADQG